MPSKIQGLCMVNSAGHHYMCSVFDNLSPHCRRLLTRSHYNVCAYCFRLMLQGDTSAETILQEMEYAIETGKFTSFSAFHSSKETTPRKVILCP